PVRGVVFFVSCFLHLFFFPGFFISGVRGGVVLFFLGCGVWGVFWGVLVVVGCVVGFGAVLQFRVLGLVVWVLGVVVMVVCGGFWLVLFDWVLLDLFAVVV
ncbi:hypothetical protein, partial [Pseudomonas syringae group genomosp. 7]|uniref:hypothetical protein n=1 Tax=Pseudomonas syringae group genomosp. 7 TaxID=251699 RepID=UPI00376F9FCF